MKKIFKILLRSLPALLIFCCNWYLSSQEHVEQMPNFWNADKLVHCICFGALTFWAAFGIDNKTIKHTWLILLPIIIVSLYGVIDEIHQSFTPGRDSSVADWIADTIGAILGSAIYFYLRMWWIKRK